MNATEVAMNLDTKKAREKNRPSGNEAAILFYLVPASNNPGQKTDPAEEIHEVLDPEQIGLPPQPKRYIRYSDHDCL